MSILELSEMFVAFVDLSCLACISLVLVIHFHSLKCNAAVCVSHAVFSRINIWHIIINQSINQSPMVTYDYLDQIWDQTLSLNFELLSCTVNKIQQNDLIYMQTSPSRILLLNYECVNAHDFLRLWDVIEDKADFECFIFLCPLKRHQFLYSVTKTAELLAGKEIEETAYVEVLDIYSRPRVPLFGR